MNRVLCFSKNSLTYFLHCKKRNILYILPRRQIKSTVRFRRRIKNQRWQIQNITPNKKCSPILSTFTILTTFCSKTLRYWVICHKLKTLRCEKTRFWRKVCKLRRKNIFWALFFRETAVQFQIKNVRWTPESQESFWMLSHVFCLCAIKQSFCQHFWMVVRHIQAIQKTPLKATHRIFIVKLCRDLPENKMSINNSYIVPYILSAGEEVIRFFFGKTQHNSIVPPSHLEKAVLCLMLARSKFGKIVQQELKFGNSWWSKKLLHKIFDLFGASRKL